MVSQIVKEGNTFIVDGRCVERPIRVGDVFDKVINVHMSKTAKTHGPAVMQEKASIALKVESIMAYQKKLTELDTAMTGRLTLSGTGGDLVNPDEMLARI